MRLIPLSILMQKFSKEILRIRIVRRKFRKKPKLKYNRKLKIRSRNNSEYLLHKYKTRSLVEEKIKFYKDQYKIKHNIELRPSGRVAIRNTVSRWGSCSSKGNLNFSYKLSLLPERLVDYIVVHELCHLIEFNHGPNFWKLVGLEIKDYSRCRLDLREYSLRS